MLANCRSKKQFIRWSEGPKIDWLLRLLLRTLLPSSHWCGRRRLRREATRKATRVNRHKEEISRDSGLCHAYSCWSFNHTQLYSICKLIKPWGQTMAVFDHKAFTAKSGELGIDLLDLVHLHYPEYLLKKTCPNWKKSCRIPLNTAYTCAL